MIRLRPLAATLAAAALLTGCSNADPEIPAVAATAATKAPATITSKAAATPGTTAGIAPDAMPDLFLTPPPQQGELSKARTVDGAGAFASYYISVLNYARQTSSTALLSEISDAGCTTCQSDIQEIREFQSEGLFSKDLKIEFKGTEVQVDDVNNGYARLTVLTHRPAHQVVDAQGSLIENVPELSQGIFTLELEWIDNHWIVWEVS